MLAAAVITLPFALGLAPAAVIFGVACGAVLAGIAASGSEPGSRGGIPLSAHATYDWAIGTALVCAAITLGFADGSGSLILFLAAGAAELALSASTRYSASRA